VERSLQLASDMPCYEPETDIVWAAYDACYAPDEVPLCPAPYSMEALAGGDDVLHPFFDAYGLNREDLDRKADITLSDEYGDLSELVDAAVHAAGPDCIHELSVPDAGVFSDPQPSGDLKRLQGEMCYDGYLSLEGGEYDEPLMRDLAADLHRPVGAGGVMCFLPLTDENGVEEQNCQVMPEAGARVDLYHGAQGPFVVDPGD